GDLLAQRQRCHSRVGRLGVVGDGDAALGEEVAEPMQKNVAARFGDVEDADLEPVKALRSGEARPDCRTSLRGRVEEHSHVLTSLVTGVLPRAPPASQPPMMPENMPASLPARTIIMPPGRNLLTVLPAS